MKTKLLIFLALFGFAYNAQASIAILKAEVFHCSDGNDYNVARHFWGGYGPGSWNLVGICSLGTLTREDYEGRVMNARDADPDIARCQDEETPAIKFCAEEFIHYNGTQGPGLNDVLHGRKSSANTSPSTQLPRGRFDNTQNSQTGAQ